MESFTEAKRYFRKMRDMYHSKLSEYVQELTFISEKLERYDKIIEEKQKKRIMWTPSQNYDLHSLLTTLLILAKIISIAILL